MTSATTESVLAPLLDLLAGDGVYGSSHLKRHRSTKVEVERRREALVAIISGMKPMTVRQVFYQASVRGLEGRVRISESANRPHRDAASR